jgi:Rod binding domain-containing protein
MMHMLLKSMRDAKLRYTNLISTNN